MLPKLVHFVRALKPTTLLFDFFLFFIITTFAPQKFFTPSLLLYTTQLSFVGGVCKEAPGSLLFGPGVPCLS
jgi:hypothetical protein